MYNKRINKTNNAILKILELNGINISLLDRNIQSGRLDINIEWELMNQFRVNKIDELIKLIISYRESFLAKATYSLSELIAAKWIPNKSIKIANKLKKILN